jgi:hypothetical protein
MLHHAGIPYTARRVCRLRMIFSFSGMAINP